MRTATVHPPKSKTETLNEMLGIRVSHDFKVWVQSQMDHLGVPNRARAEFLRGCLAYAVRSTSRAKDPRWTAFAKATEEQARQHLGAPLALESARDIAALGFWKEDVS